MPDPQERLLAMGALALQECVAALTHHPNEERQFFREASLCATRMRPHRDQQFEIRTPTAAVGEIGTVSGFLNVAYLAYAQHQALFEGQGAGLHLTVPDAASARGAVVVCAASKPSDKSAPRGGVGKGVGA